jgi:HK97 family phage portal protein
LRESALPRVKGAVDLGTSTINDKSFMRMILGDSSRSGVYVDRDVALTYSAIWAGVGLLSAIEAHLPLKKYRKTENGREEVTDSTSQLLQYKASRSMTANHWRKLQMQTKLMYGYSISVIERSVRGVPTGIRWVHPSCVEITLEKTGELRYRITEEEGNPVIYQDSDIIHINNTILQRNGLLGQSFISAGADSIGMAIGIERSASSFLGNGSFPSGVLETDQIFKDDKDRQSFLNSWTKIYSGVDNSGKTALLENGVKYKPISVTPKDAQLIESRTFGPKDIARWLQLPSFLLNSSDDTTYNNITTLDLSFVKYFLVPNHLTPNQGEYWSKLLTQDEKDAGYYYEYNVDGLLKGDPEKIANISKELVLAGIWTPNEVRESVYNKNKLEGGDERYVPANIVGKQDGESTEA